MKHHYKAGANGVYYSSEFIGALSFNTDELRRILRERGRTKVLDYIDANIEIMLERMEEVVKRETAFFAIEFFQEEDPYPFRTPGAQAAEEGSDGGEHRSGDVAHVPL